MSCPVCLHVNTAQFLVARDIRLKTSQRDFAFHRCQSCSSLYIYPQPSPEQITSFYPEQYWWSSTKDGILNKAESIYRTFMLFDHISFILQTIRRLSTPNKGLRILDVGCGSANILGELKKKGFQVTGVDPSEKASTIAQREHGVKVLVGSLDQIHFPDNSFELAMQWNVLEHVTNPREVLLETHRILAPNGRLLLQVPNVDCLQFRLFGSRWTGLDTPRHVIIFSTQSITRLLLSTGFEVERIRHFSLRDNPAGLASSLFPQLDPIGRRVRAHRGDISESAPTAWVCRMIYLLLFFCSIPFALGEHAVQRGASIMIQAKRK